MGLENRDYYRNTGGSGHGVSSFADVPQVCKMLLIANVVVFIAQIVMTRPASPFELRDQMTEIVQDQGEVLSPEEIEFQFEQIHQMSRFQPRRSLVQEWFELDPQKVAGGQIWRLVTSAFCHSRFGIWHLLFNMLFLFWFGSRLEQIYGGKEFALFYFASAIAASLAYLALCFYIGDSTPAIGASGAVWGIVALYALKYPYETIRIYFLFPIEIRWLALLYFALDLHPVLLSLSGQGFDDGVAHAAHLGGAIFGFGYYKRDWRLEPHWDRLPWLGNRNRANSPSVFRMPPKSQGSTRRKGSTQRKQSQPNLKVHREDIDPVRPMDPELERLELSLDQVLEKIHLHGRESLSDTEVAVLEKASRKYRGE